MSPELIALGVLLIVSVAANTALAFIISSLRPLKDKIEKTKETNAELAIKIDALTDQNTKLTELNLDFNRENSELKDSNYDLATLNEEYVLFVRRVHSVLDEDIGFLQGELAQKLSLDIPEVKSLYQGLQRLRDDMSSIKDVVEESERIKNE